MTLKTRVSTSSITVRSWQAVSPPGLRKAVLAGLAPRVFDGVIDRHMLLTGKCAVNAEGLYDNNQLRNNRPPLMTHAPLDDFPWDALWLGRLDDFFVISGLVCLTVAKYSSKLLMIAAGQSGDSQRTVPDTSLISVDGDHYNRSTQLLRSPKAWSS